MKKYKNFSKALNNLKEAAKLREPYSVVEQTGIAGLFAICFEQAWKLMKEALEKNGVFQSRTGSPKSILKSAFEFKMIDDENGWLRILETRNILAHTYSDEDSLSAIKNIKEEYLTLFERLKAEIDANWSE